LFPATVAFRAPIVEIVAIAPVNPVHIGRECIGAA
jgi:hypothetical protein